MEVVGSVQEAVEIINTHGSSHTDAIITEDGEGGEGRGGEGRGGEGGREGGRDGWMDGWMDGWVMYYYDGKV